MSLYYGGVHIFLRLPGRYTTWSAPRGRRYTSYTEASLTWAIHIFFTDLKACLQISVHAFERFMLRKGLCQYCRVDYHTYVHVHFNK